MREGRLSLSPSPLPPPTHQVPFYVNFKELAESHESKLSKLTECLSLLNIIQRKWVYLAPIFGRGALPSKQALFQGIDRAFRDIMKRIKGNRLVMGLVEKRGDPQARGSPFEPPLKPL